MPKIMEIIAKETNGKSYHTYKYSYDSIGVPSIDYDDDPNKVMKWKDSGETSSPIYSSECLFCIFFAPFTGFTFFHQAPYSSVI